MVNTGPITAEKSPGDARASGARRVLIVDDDRDFADSMATVLQPRRYEVVTSNSIEQALTAAAEFEAQVALLDIRLKTDNGLHLIEKLRQRRPNMQCLMVTAYADIETAISAVQQGVYDYLRKPVNPPDLFAALDRCFEHLQLQEQAVALERRLQQAERLEAVGRLAGGVAHDFNNMLMAVMGNVELSMRAARAMAGDPNPIEEYLRDIEHVTRRSAALTRQLLAFASQRAVQHASVDLSQVLRDMERMLRRLVHENIDFEIVAAPDDGTVRADPVQIEQVILNLVVNAQDAMPKGGKLRVETRTETAVPAGGARGNEAGPAEQVVLMVSDTGRGIAQEDLDHIFEPFFTTKEIGKGTGLGLATVYGIVKHADGEIAVDSPPGVGTTFTIRFPAEEAQAAEVARPRAESAPVMGGGETILLCEDDAVLRNMLVRLLDANGYTVLAAANGEEALSIAAECQGAPAALVTDLIMPGMNGRELAEEMRRRHPGIRVIVSSGYTNDVIGPADLRRMMVLEKPYPPSKLLQLLRQVLSEPAADE